MQALKDEHRKLVDLQGFLRRHECYIGRNNNGKYGVIDFVQLWLAREIAAKILEEVNNCIKEQLRRERTEERMELVKKIKKYENALRYSNTHDSVIDVSYEEEDCRDFIGELYDFEVKLLSLRQKAIATGDDVEQEEEKYCLPFHLIFSSEVGQRMFISSSESASWQDIIEGHEEDLLHLVKVQHDAYQASCQAICRCLLRC